MNDLPESSSTPVSDAFAVATAVTPIGGGRYSSEIHPGWDIGGNANGGYLMAIAGRAMADVAGRPPLTLTAHYLRPGPAGPCEIVVETVRSGRRLATLRASMLVDGQPTLELLGTFGDQQPDSSGPTYAREAPVELTPYSESAGMPGASEGAGPALMERLACRLEPGDDGFRRDEPTGDPAIRGWFALVGHEPIDAIGLLLAADAFPPPVFNTEIPVSWVPTIELTVHIRGLPVAGPLRCAFRTRFIGDGLLDEEGEMWDQDGTLVAQCRQMSLVPRT